MADAVNLRHRHPVLWALVMEGAVVAWVARRSASKVAAAGLTRELARWVDEATAEFAATLTPGRFLALVDAKIIEADPVVAQARAQQRALERFVRTGQSDEHGLKTLIARATAGEIIYLEAVIDRIAQILQTRGDTDPVDVRRSKALGILGNPARAVLLLAEAEQAAPDPDQDQDQEPDPELDLDGELQEARRNDPALNTAIAAWLRTLKPEKLLPKAVLYVHLTDTALHTGSGVARCEGVGPITTDQAREFLTHTHVSVRPVLDLAGVAAVDAYEVPPRMHEALRLIHPQQTSPYATGSSRRADNDHTKPYLPPSTGGPPGQTRLGNLGPLGRRQHRLKTHAPGWRHHQIGIGSYLWRTPTGHWTYLNQHGTHTLGTTFTYKTPEEQLRDLTNTPGWPKR